jgi:hypothetical protein
MYKLYPHEIAIKLNNLFIQQLQHMAFKELRVYNYVSSQTVHVSYAINYYVSGMKLTIAAMNLLGYHVRKIIPIPYPCGSVSKSLCKIVITSSSYLPFISAILRGDPFFGNV